MTLLSMTQVRELLQTEITKVGNASQWAAKAGVSKAYVSDVLAGRRDPGPSIAKALRLKVHRKTEIFYTPLAR